MTDSNETDNVLPVPQNQGTSGTSSSGLYYGITIEDKLLMLNRTPYLKYFQELQNNQLVTSDLWKACTWLMHDMFSVNNRDCAVETIAHLLWPPGAWRKTKDQLFIYLDVSLHNQAYITQQRI
jgi:hypothetical protein